MSPSATPATQSGTASRATNGDQARHQTQPSVISTTPAMQNEGGCRQVPRLPRETTVDVTKCHACHAKWSGVTGDQRVTRPSQASQVPPLPRKTKVDVAKRHACHMKRRWMSPSATPTMQSRAASRATNGDQARHQTQPSVTNTTLAAQNEGGCRQAARQPRKTEVGVAKCHACHAKWHGVTGDQRGPSASPDPAKCHKYHACHAKRRWMSPSATPAT